MKIAIDTGPLTSGHKVRGIGVHTRELVNELKKIKDKGISIQAVDFSKTNLSKFDLIHYPYFHPYFPTLPSNKFNGKLVVTIHDLIPLIFPKQYPPGFRGKVNFLKQKANLSKVDGVLTISETSKKDICRLLPIYPDKVKVVHLAQKKIYKEIKNKEELRVVKEKYKLTSRFVLYVGDINYNKNIPALIKACELAKLPLVICGKQALDIEEKGVGMDVLKGPQDWVRFLFSVPHPELAHYQTLVDSFRGKTNIKRPGFVPDDDLAAIFNLASVYCAPSLYEGFGLPLLEAMASGLPVVASKIQAHVEVAQDGALYFKPRSLKDMAEKLKKGVGSESLRRELIKKGNMMVKKYSWAKTARETLKYYKDVINR